MGTLEQGYTLLVIWKSVPEAIRWGQVNKGKQYYTSTWQELSMGLDRGLK